MVLLRNRVLVREIEQKRTSGIIISNNGNKTGMVVNKGEDVSVVDIGDIVMFGPDAGVEEKINGEKYILIRDLDLFALVNEH